MVDGRSEPRLGPERRGQTWARLGLRKGVGCSRAAVSQAQNEVADDVFVRISALTAQAMLARRCLDHLGRLRALHGALFRLLDGLENCETQRTQVPATTSV